MLIISFVPVMTIIYNYVCFSVYFARSGSLFFLSFATRLCVLLLMIQMEKEKNERRALTPRRASSLTVVVRYRCQTFGFRFEFDAFVINFHDTFECRFLDRCHFAR